MQKLKPFFPPLEHLQSLNLRAALFRCLDQVKKTGLLGRDAVLRKTMLDECKGEKLEEVLAVFSTAVLKKVIQERDDGNHTAITERLAMENFSYNGERTNLSTLIMAHKASLSKALAMKKESRARYNDFADLLNLRERQTIRRHEQLKVSVEGEPVDLISDQDAQILQGRVEKNWTGSNEWLETILHGDNWSRKEGLLSTSFDSVWEYVEDGIIGDLEYQERKGLLEQLDSRIRQQSHRLAQWQSFERTLANDGHKNTNERRTSELKRKAKGIDLSFPAHETLQLIRSPLKIAEAPKRASLGQYAQLIENMQKELASVGKPRAPGMKPNRTVEAYKIENNGPALLPDDPMDTPSSLQPEHHSESNSDTDGASHRSENYAKSVSQTPPSEHVADLDEELSPTQSVNSAVDDENEQVDGPIDIPATTRHTSLHSDMPPPSPPSRTASPLAFEILASVLTTSPSPTKPRHVLSLAERTRLSMSRASVAKASYQSEDSDDNLPKLVSNPQPHKLKRSSKSITGQRNEIVEPTSTDEAKTVQGDLISRTRLSMSNFAAVQKNAQIDRRRSIKAAARNKRESRSSYFPKPLEPAVEDEDLMFDGLDRKKLIEGEVEVDYDVVFKSRPRIKTSPERSPQRSPVKAWGEMGGRGDMGGSSSPMSEGY